MKREFLKALKEEKPLQIVGVLNALVAKMAEKEGFKALYLSGASLSSGAFALPDLGLLSLETLILESRRITAATHLPLLVDIDTGWDNPLLLQRAVQELSQVGVSALQIEDQILQKRCGHREGKKVIASSLMEEKISLMKKTNDNLFIVARTDALEMETIEKTIERAKNYAKAGADMIFIEAVTALEIIQTLRQRIDTPLMINLTEFGKTAPFSKNELKGIDALLYPMTIARTMYKRAQNSLKELKNDKQKELIPQMLTRDELYTLIDYEEKEKLFS